MLFPYQVVADSQASIPLVGTMGTVDAESPMAAVHKLARDGALPKDGPTFWVRIVTAVHDNGMPHKIISVPITPHFIPDDAE